MKKKYTTYLQQLALEKLVAFKTSFFTSSTFLALCESFIAIIKQSQLSQLVETSNFLCVIYCCLLRTPLLAYLGCTLFPFVVFQFNCFWKHYVVMSACDISCTQFFSRIERLFLSTHGYPLGKIEWLHSLRWWVNAFSRVLCALWRLLVRTAIPYFWSAYFWSHSLHPSWRTASYLLTSFRFDV